MPNPKYKCRGQHCLSNFALATHLCRLAGFSVKIRSGQQYQCAPYGVLHNSTISSLSATRPFAVPGNHPGSVIRIVRSATWANRRRATQI